MSCPPTKIPFPHQEATKSRLLLVSALMCALFLSFNCSFNCSGAEKKPRILWLGYIELSQTR